jgi:sulfatase maturation enzyme AslB (radical SAM superfamily)
MRYSKFRINNGIEFYYDNVDNKLHEATGEMIQFNNGDYTEYRNFAKANYASRKKHNRPVALRILLGHACNYSCTYCLQKDIGNPDELPKREGLERFFYTVRET